MVRSNFKGVYGGRSGGGGGGGVGGCPLSPVSQPRGDVCCFSRMGIPQNVRNVDGERFQRRHGGCAGSACPVIGRCVATVLCEVKPDTGAITCTWKEQAIHWICKVGGGGREGGREGERETE